MASNEYYAWDHKEWEAAGLNRIQERHEMTYVNQSPDGYECYRGEWFIADDATRTIVFGTFGNYNSPGASSYTYAQVFDNEEEYKKELAEWDAKPEYLEREEEESDDVDDNDEDEESEDDDLLYPVVDAEGREHFEVNVPGDLYGTMGELADHAIDVAREQAATYVIPCQWEAKHVKGELGGYEVTFDVIRTK